MKIKVSKVRTINPFSKKVGVSARVITAGTAEFDELCNEASKNTTAHKSEIRLGFELGLEEAARQLKNGMIVDLGPLGKLYPSCSSGWKETEEELTMDMVRPRVKYMPSADIKAAIQGASLSWAKGEEAASANTSTDSGDTPDSDDDEGGFGGGF